MRDPQTKEVLVVKRWYSGVWLNVISYEWSGDVVTTIGSSLFFEYNVNSRWFRWVILFNDWLPIIKETITKSKWVKLDEGCTIWEDEVEEQLVI